MPGPLRAAAVPESYNAQGCICVNKAIKGATYQGLKTDLDCGRLGRRLTTASSTEVGVYLDG